MKNSYSEVEQLYVSHFAGKEWVWTDLLVINTTHQYSFDNLTSIVNFNGTLFKRFDLGHGWPTG